MLNSPHPASTRPSWNSGDGARCPRRHAVSKPITPSAISTIVPMWKKPSATVLASKPSTVVTGLPPVSLIM